jgi:hypothetical protein
MRELVDDVSVVLVRVVVDVSVLVSTTVVEVSVITVVVDALVVDTVSVVDVHVIVDVMVLLVRDVAVKVNVVVAGVVLLVLVCELVMSSTMGTLTLRATTAQAPLLLDISCNDACSRFSSLPFSPTAVSEFTTPCVASTMLSHCRMRMI